jgi:hypothetical protein
MIEAEEAAAAAVAVAPRVTLEDLKAKIASKDFITFPADAPRLTVCVLTMANGFIVTGESSCVNPDNFNRELGQLISETQATDKAWMLEGYLLRDRLSKQAALNDVYAIYSVKCSANEGENLDASTGYAEQYASILDPTFKPLVLRVGEDPNFFPIK